MARRPEHVGPRASRDRRAPAHRSALRRRGPGDGHPPSDRDGHLGRALRAGARLPLGRDRTALRALTREENGSDGLEPATPIALRQATRWRFTVTERSPAGVYRAPATN